MTARVLAAIALVASVIGGTSQAAFADRERRAAHPAAAAHGEGSGSLEIVLAGLAVLSITDPLGRRLYYDADSSRYVSNIPSSMAEQGSSGSTEDSTASPPSDRIDIPKALDGEYRIEVIGQGPGRFGISIVDHDAEGGVTGWTDTGMSVAGSRDAYIVRFSSKPGAPLEVRKVYRGGAELEITLTGAAALSITDPHGHKIQYDAENDRYVSEIPSSDADRGSSIWDPADSTAETPAADAVAIRDAINGEYRIDVIGLGQGWFGLSVIGYDADGASNGGGDGWGASTAGSRTVYVVEFSSKAGVPVRVREVSRGMGSLKVMLFGEATLSLTDPLGRRVRYDARSRDYMSEIPLCSAARQTLGLGPRSLRGDYIEIENAADGDFRIEVLGYLAGDFRLSIDAHDTESGATTWEATGTTTPGSRLIYIVKFSSTPGAPVEVHEVVPDILRGH
jgi:hypothetical protein